MAENFPTWDQAQAPLATLLTETQSTAEVQIIKNVLAKPALQSPEKTPAARLQQVKKSSQTSSAVAIDDPKVNLYAKRWPPLQAGTTLTNDQKKSLRTSAFASQKGSVFFVPSAELQAAFLGILKTYADWLLKNIAYKETEIYARNNLFHGHLVYHDTWGYLAVLHAEEFPSDLTKYEIDRDAVAKALEPENYKAVSMYSKDYKLRNAIYSFAQNTLYILDFRTKAPPANTFTNLLDETTLGGLAVSADNVGEEKTGYILDFNYFSHEYPTVFCISRT